MSSETFYADLPAFQDFGGFSDLDAYTPLPDDWVVLASDVVGSTRAVAEGRYKQVNMAGAATIMAALNAAKGLDAPYAFGGDGAVIAVPPSVKAAGREALARTAGRIKEACDLTLRISAFPVRDLRALDGDIRVRKYALGQSARLAMFAGPGIALADQLLKDEDVGARYRITPSDAPPDIDGLSCRWEPLNPTHGQMVAVIVACVGGDESETLGRLRMRIQTVLGGDETVAAPVSDGSLKFVWPPRNLGMEARTLVGLGGSVRKLLQLGLESLAQAWAERFGKRVGPYDALAYRKELAAQTDFRKFTGHLRLVLDITPAQADALARVLADERQAGRICYGMHRADKGLMTCLVFDLAASDHVHFIDGADGGFYLAAAELKRQMAALEPQG